MQVIQEKNPLHEGFVTFVSFVVVGLLPIFPFFISVIIPSFRTYDVMVSLGLSLCAFVGIGYIGARVTKTSRMKNILRTVFVGGTAALISFLVGYLLRNVG